MRRLLMCSLLVAGCGGGSSTDPTAPFVGTWNYDQPVRSSALNIGTVTCPSPGPSLVVPQIGNIVITKSGDGTIRGKTDQGCTWSFSVEGATANLSPPKQTCFNQVIGSSYTLDWSMSIDGAKESEVISGISHLPAGDCDFELAHASRTKVDPASTIDPTAAFVGTWSYDAPDPMTGVNIEQLSCDSQPSYAPVVGTLTVTKIGAGQLQAATDGGCVWTFSVAGNTAELSPARQSCDGQRLTMTFWSMTSDGQHADEFASGVRHETMADCAALVTAGSLTKQ